MKEKMIHFKLCRSPVELAQVLEMYLTRILREKALTLSEEIGRLLEKLHLAMNKSAPLQRRPAEERATLSTRGRPATRGSCARVRHLPTNFAVGPRRHRRRGSARRIAHQQSHRRRGSRGLCSLHPRIQMKPLLLTRLKIH